ncbi:hypothetical protein [Kitasatospora sp. NPDC059571]|uniref:hypothetical protein n=1 Tax=Kitasatospora sp. NPDC059571 TaxID=3346871 RepID=UPI00367EB1BC
MNTGTRHTPTDPPPAPTTPGQPGLILDVRPHWKNDAHRLLLNLAGRLPDAALTRLRALLAANDRTAFAADLGHTVVAEATALSEPDEDLVAELLEADGLDSSPLDDLPPLSAETALHITHTFTAQQPAGELNSGDHHDASDRAAVAAVAHTPGIRGLWRTWRWPADTDSTPPRRIHLVETDRTVDLPALAARLQQHLETPEDPHPQVEAYATGAALPRYQQLARTHGTLLWMPTPHHPLRLAPVFDEPHAESGPRFLPDHPRTTDPGEAALVIAYLRSGELLLASPELADDILRPYREAVVPVDIRTDGAWIWTDATTYYLEEHGLEPHPDLLAHIRAAAYAAPEVDGATRHRAIDLLTGTNIDERAFGLRLDTAAGLL